jgi:hypothetical protein
VAALMIGTLSAAVFLRAAIALYNKLAGGASSPSSVPEPDFGKAMGISFVTCLVQVVAGFLLDLVTGTGAGAARAGGKGIDVQAQLISFPMSLVITAAMLSALLPTTLTRALLVTLCEMLIVVLVVGIALVVIAVSGAGLTGA